MAKNDNIVIHAVGDIMLGDLPTCYGFGAGSNLARMGPPYPFEHCSPIWKNSDIVFGNLETVISAFDKKSEPFSRTVLRAQPIAAECLKQAGFNVLNLANNHIMQHGRKAVEETINNLNSHSINTIGIEIPENNIENSTVVNVHGVDVCFLGYNQRPLQYFLDPHVYVEFSLDRVRNDIDRARRRAGIVIISIHWGEEFVNTPSREQIEIAHKIAEFGADLILGHHSHQIQGIEMYGKTVIAYSLGNFVFDMWQKRLRETMVLKVELLPGNTPKFEVIPMFISDDYRPQQVEHHRINSALNYLSEISEALKSPLPEYKYQELVKIQLAKYRREVYSHYLTSAFRFNPRDLVKNIIGAIGRRLPRSY